MAGRTKTKIFFGKILPSLRNLMLLGLFLLIAWYFSRWQGPSWIQGEFEMVSARFTLCSERYSQHCVVDGDTILIAKRKIRLSGYDAPELEGACAQESQLARKAGRALRDWLNQGPFVMSGGDDPNFDKYGRELRETHRRGGNGARRYLADHMIHAGLAEGSGWGAIRREWC